MWSVRASAGIIFKVQLTWCSQNLWWCPIRHRIKCRSSGGISVNGFHSVFPYFLSLNVVFQLHSGQPGILWKYSEFCYLRCWFKPHPSIYGILSFIISANEYPSFSSLSKSIASSLWVSLIPCRWN